MINKCLRRDIRRSERPALYSKLRQTADEECCLLTNKSEVYRSPFSRSDIKPNTMFCRKSLQTEQGIILLTVLLCLIVIALLIQHLLLSVQLQLRMSARWKASAQQFQAAEAGLRYGENWLMQPDTSRSALTTLSALPALDYAGYQVTVTILSLPQAFCLLPKRQRGYYYQVTATATQHRYTNPIILQSTIALPDGRICPKKAIQRMQGRSAWLQLK